MTQFRTFTEPMGIAQACLRPRLTANTTLPAELVAVLLSRRVGWEITEQAALAITSSLGIGASAYAPGHRARHGFYLHASAGIPIAGDVVFGRSLEPAHHRSRFICALSRHCVLGRHIDVDASVERFLVDRGWEVMRARPGRMLVRLPNSHADAWLSGWVAAGHELEILERGNVRRLPRWSA